jgi:hypothetical protein
MSCTVWRIFTLLVAGLSLTASAHAAEMLPDPGFEDTRPLLPEDPTLSDPWRRTFFTVNPMSTDATVMPASGVQHASLTRDMANPGAEPVIDTTIFAGFGGAAGITDFRGKTLDFTVKYKVAENTVLDSTGEVPGSFLRTYLYYYEAGTFGTFTDVWVGGTTDGYVTLSYNDVVPNAASPITTIGYNLAVLGQGGGTGRVTVYFDDASLIVVPEPVTLLMAAAFAPTALLRRRRGR